MSRYAEMPAGVIPIGPARDFELVCPDGAQAEVEAVRRIDTPRGRIVQFIFRPELHRKTVSVYDHERVQIEARDWSRLNYSDYGQGIGPRRRKGESGE